MSHLTALIHDWNAPIVVPSHLRHAVHADLKVRDAAILLHPQLEPYAQKALEAKIDEIQTKIARMCERAGVPV